MSVNIDQALNRAMQVGIETALFAIKTMSREAAIAQIEQWLLEDKKITEIDE